MECNRGYSDGLLIENYDPSNEKFSFNFTKDTCSYIGKSICALENVPSEQDYKNYDFRYDKYKYPRCVSIYFGLKKGTINNIRMLPCIIKHSCGHFSCNDGQHRICVAQKFGFKLDVCYYENLDELCPDCMGDCSLLQDECITNMKIHVTDSGIIIEQEKIDD